MRRKKSDKPRLEVAPSKPARIARKKLTDELLLRAIGDNSRMSAEKIARKLNVTPTTIRRRLKTATRKGLMRTVAVVDPAKAGLDVLAVLGFNVSRENLQSVISSLETQSEIKWLATVTGGFDIIARTAFHSVEELSTFLRETPSDIKGIDNIESFISLDTPKGRFISLD